MTMTISQALRKIKKLKGQLAECTARAGASVSYPAAHPPAFVFGSMLDQATALRKEITRLETRLAVTNAITMLADPKAVIVGMCLTHVVRELQEIKSEIAWLKTLPVRAHVDTIQEEIEWTYEADNKRVRREIPWRCELPEDKRSALVDALQERFDRLNDLIERANHTTVLTGD